MIGHARFLLEAIGPELRQYIVAGNDEERPFSRDQRRWVYASSKLQNNYFGFGTDNDFERSLGQRDRPPPHVRRRVPDPRHRRSGGLAALGEGARRTARTPPRVPPALGREHLGDELRVTVRHAIEAINRGAAEAGCLHNTGEGGVSPYHRQGGELVFQIGTAYFGCRDERGSVQPARLKELVDGAPVRALEIKLSQGAKPGLGGVLPAAKVSREIAETRGVPEDQDCLSPSRHAEFGDADSMLDFVEMLADETGLPVGIKSAVGDLTFWQQLTDLMARDDRGVDFVTIDGGEGGTGASPLIFTDAVSLPFRVGFARVYAEFAAPRTARGRDVHRRRQARAARQRGRRLRPRRRHGQRRPGGDARRRLHPGPEVPHRRCPTGVATQHPWLTRGLDPVVEGRAGSQLRADAAARPAEGRGDLRRPAPRPDRAAVDRGRRRAHRRTAAGGHLRLRARLGLPVLGGPHPDRRDHGGDRRAGSGHGGAAGDLGGWRPCRRRGRRGRRSTEPAQASVGRISLP